MGEFLQLDMPRKHDSLARLTNLMTENQTSLKSSSMTPGSIVEVFRRSVPKINSRESEGDGCQSSLLSRVIQFEFSGCICINMFGSLSTLRVACLVELFTSCSNGLVAGLEASGQQSAQSPP
jgi:hypothetical protein